MDARYRKLHKIELADDLVIEDYIRGIIKKEIKSQRK